MCGRFSLSATEDDLAKFLGLGDFPTFEPRYNIAPSQFVASLRINHENKNPEICLLQWGFIPSWTKEKDKAPKPINARSETIHQKPSFKGPFKRKRCLIPTNGFYEWQRKGKSKNKQPFRFQMKNRSVFAMAAIWDCWWTPDSSPLETCTILTTRANELLTPYHHRMPVILKPEQFNTWLNIKDEDTNKIHPLMQPFPAKEMTVTPVSTYLNNARHEGTRCIEPISKNNDNEDLEHRAQGMLF